MYTGFDVTVLMMTGYPNHVVFMMTGYPYSVVLLRYCLLSVLGICQRMRSFSPSSVIFGVWKRLRDML